MRLTKLEMQGFKSFAKKTELQFGSGITAVIGPIAKAGVAVGFDGLFMETHPEPAKALSDGANMLPLSELKPLLVRLLRIRKAILL